MKSIVSCGAATMLVLLLGVGGCAMDGEPDFWARSQMRVASTSIPIDINENNTTILGIESGYWTTKVAIDCQEIIQGSVVMTGPTWKLILLPDNKVIVTLDGVCYKQQLALKCGFVPIDGQNMSIPLGQWVQENVPGFDKARLGKLNLPLPSDKREHRRMTAVESRPVTLITFSMKKSEDFEGELSWYVSENWSNDTNDSEWLLHLL